VTASTAVVCIYVHAQCSSFTYAHSLRSDAQSLAVTAAPHSCRHSSVLCAHAMQCTLLAAVVSVHSSQCDAIWRHASVQYALHYHILQSSGTSGGSAASAAAVRQSSVFKLHTPWSDEYQVHA
jgi:hypothetical protein